LVEVYDGPDSKNTHLLATTVLANENGVYTVQFDQAVPGNNYYFLVRAIDPTGSNSSGRYFLGVNFHQGPPVTLNALAAGTLTGSDPSLGSALQVNGTVLLHFSLSASIGSSSTAEEAWMQIFDNQGHLVFSLDARPSAPAWTGTVYLESGSYT